MCPSHNSKLKTGCSYNTIYCINTIIFIAVKSQKYDVNRHFQYLAVDAVITREESGLYCTIRNINQNQINQNYLNMIAPPSVPPSVQKRGARAQVLNTLSDV